MIQTKNLYYSAYLFNEGLELVTATKEVDESTGEVAVYFRFEGENENKYKALYNRGKALTNIRGYLEALMKLRDILFAVMNGKGVVL